MLVMAALMLVVLKAWVERVRGLVHSPEFTHQAPG
jgi:hypothetical protein